MPRDSNGNYSLPAGNPVTTNTPIAITWANGTMSDIGTVLTASLDRSGNGGMLAALKLDSGLVGAPGLTFGAETTLGLYRVSAGVLGVAVGGAQVANFSATGLAVTGTLVPSGVISAPVGTAALPSHTFTGDLNTGMSAATADTLVLSTGGTARLTLTSALATFAPVVGGPAGTAAAPGISFSGDLDTGVSAQTANTLILSTAGVARGTFSAASIALAATAIGLTGAITATGVLTTTSTIELGHASDTTLSRLSAGVVGIEGEAVQVGESGTFTGTLTGCTTSPTATFNYTIVGNMCTITLDSGSLTGTSNTTACTITGLPAACTPASLCNGFGIQVFDDGTACLGRWSVAGTTITLNTGLISGSRVITSTFTSSGTKGLLAGTVITYSLE